MLNAEYNKMKAFISFVKQTLYDIIIVRDLFN